MVGWDVCDDATVTRARRVACLFVWLTCLLADLEWIKSNSVLSAVGGVFSYVLLICPPSVCSSDCEPHQNTKHLLQVSLCAIFSLCTFVHCAQNHVTFLVFAFVARLLLSKRAVLL